MRFWVLHSKKELTSQFLAVFLCCSWEAVNFSGLCYYIIQNPNLSVSLLSSSMFVYWGLLGSTLSHAGLFFFPLFIKCSLCLQLSRFLRLLLACRCFGIQRPFFNFILFPIKLKLAVHQVQFSLRLYFLWFLLGFIQLDKRSTGSSLYWVSCEASVRKWL